jgi:polysaccharide biosynthesis protein PslH
LRILFLSPRQCWPALSGAKLREYHLARALGQDSELTYVYFSQGLPVAPADLPFCRHLIPVPKPSAYTPGKIIRGLVTGVPLSVINYTSKEMSDTLAGLAGRPVFDLAHVDSIHMAGYLPIVAGTTSRVIMHWHNIESELMARYAANSAFPKKLYAALTARRLAALEDKLLSSCFGHVVCSERERQLLLARAPRARVAVVENGVDTQSFAVDGDTRRRVVFVGSMGYHANTEAALYFTSKIWPALNKLFPAWTLTLVGSDPPPSVRALTGLYPAVEVTGTVPDVRPFYREALLAIVPLRTGGGTRLKILEAFAAGVPVISTTLGAEGLNLSPGEHFLAADSHTEWVAACSAIANDAGLRRRLIQAGRKLAEDEYDWNVLGDRLVTTYRTWLMDSRLGVD